MKSGGKKRRVDAKAICTCFLNGLPLCHASATECATHEDDLMREQLGLIRKAKTEYRATLDDDDDGVYRGIASIPWEKSAAAMLVRTRKTRGASSSGVGVRAPAPACKRKAAVQLSGKGQTC